MEVFSIVEDNNEMVVLKVNSEDNLNIALNPYINANMDYISVTKSDTHILTIIKKDGSTSSFHWGLGGYTLIGENLKLLQKKVIEFTKNNGVYMGKYF